jgi:hypothetical protein
LAPKESALKDVKKRDMTAEQILSIGIGLFSGAMMVIVYIAKIND